jgi:hypothetical protein
MDKPLGSALGLVISVWPRSPNEANLHPRKHARCRPLACPSWRETVAPGLASKRSSAVTRQAHRRKKKRPQEAFPEAVLLDKSAKVGAYLVIVVAVN